MSGDSPSRRMRLALALPLALAPSLALAQSEGARCAPRVEATAAVLPSAVARLTAAVSSGAQAAPGQCPVVRFDVVAGHLVMTVVLDDGRQVARVLPTQGDALPTLVALMATPPLPEVPDEAPPVEAPSAPPVVVAAAVTPAPVPVRPVTAVAASASGGWGLRLGLSGGAGQYDGASALRGALDVEVLGDRWVFGARGVYDREGLGRQRASGASALLSVRHRWRLGRWELDAGPAAGARWGLGGTARESIALYVGAEGSVALSLGGAWSAFARVEGGANFYAGSYELDGDEGSEEGWERASGQAPADDGAGFAWGAVVGVRWEVWR